MKKAIYAGSFDPVTYGHLDIIKRSLDSIVENMIICVANNPNKTSFFTIDEKVKMIKSELCDYLGDKYKGRYSVEVVDELIVDYAKKNNISILIRGIRAISDYELEFKMAGINKSLSPDIETIFLMTSDKYQFISSGVVKEIYNNNGDISGFVGDCVLNMFKEKNEIN